MLAGVALTAAPAQANLAANTQIFNNASLSYNDGSTTRTATASVVVSVSLVPGNPNIAIGAFQTTAYAGPNTVLHNSFTVTNSGNGPDTFTLATAIAGSTNTTGPTAAVSSPLTNLSLGGSITVAGSTVNQVLVPSDGVIGSSAVNGLMAGSIVSVGAEVRTIGSVVNSGSGIAQINLLSPLTSAPGAGVTVGEQKTVTVDVTAGTIGVAGTDITVNKTLTATSTHLGTATLTSASMTDTYKSGAATLTKYVRNLTTGVVGTGSKFTHNGTDYYPSGITAKSGDVLEYILLSSNGGSGSVTASVVTDVLPTAYVTLKSGYSGGTREFMYESEAGVQSFLTAANDGDTADYVGSTITVNVGVGATPTNGTNLGGSIASGKSVFVYYQVTVNN